MSIRNSTERFDSKCEIPVLSISPIFFTTNELIDNPLKQQMLDVLVKDVTNAMENVGFIQISDPSFPSYMCEQLDQLQNQYFALPKSEKNKIGTFNFCSKCREYLSFILEHNSISEYHSL